MNNLSELSKAWLAAKQAEADATDNRRKIEDRLLSLIGVAETFEGTETAEPDGYKIKIVGRITRKVDPDLVQEIAAEHGLTDHLSTLFRWKPDINMAAWKAANEKITSLLSVAITAKPGRPSISITEE